MLILLCIIIVSPAYVYLNFGFNSLTGGSTFNEMRQEKNWKEIITVGTLAIPFLFIALSGIMYETFFKTENASS